MEGSASANEGVPLSLESVDLVHKTDKCVSLMDLVRLICDAVYRNSSEPAFVISSVTSKVNGEAWDVSLPEGMTLHNVLDNSAPRVFLEEWPEEHHHRYALAHRAALCEIMTLLVFTVIETLEDKFGVRTVLGSQVLTEMGYVRSSFPSSEVILLCHQGLTCELISPVSRIHHLFPFLKFGDRVVYVDLTYPQCGVERSLENMRVNPSTPYRLVTEDITLGGTVHACEHVHRDELGTPQFDPRLIDIDKVVEQVVALANC